MFQATAIMALGERRQALALKAALGKRLLLESVFTSAIMLAATVAVIVAAVTADVDMLSKGVLAQLASVMFLALYMLVSVLQFAGKLSRSLRDLFISIPPESPLARMLLVHLRRVRLFTVFLPGMAIPVFCLLFVPFVMFLAVGYFPFFSAVWALTILAFPTFGAGVALLMTKGRAAFTVEDSHGHGREKKYVGGAELGLNSYEEHIARRMKDVDDHALTFQAGSVMSMPETSRGDRDLASSFAGGTVGGGSRVAAIRSEEEEDHTSKLHEDMQSSQAADTTAVSGAE